MTASLSLSTSGTVYPNDNAERVLNALGVRKEKYAPFAQVEAVIRAHNRLDGKHLLDVARQGKLSFARAYGSALGWILGDYSTADAIGFIAENAGRSLRLFFNGKPESGVAVIGRKPDEYGVFLFERQICGNPQFLLDADCSLLIPTGVTSPRIGHTELYERIDLCESHDHRVKFAIKRVLFTGEDGESIAGTGDIEGMFIERLPDLLPTIYAELGDEYELLDINRRIFSAVQLHFDYLSFKEEIEIPLTDGLTVVFTLCGGNSWRVDFIIDGIRRPMTEIAPKRKFKVNAVATISARRELSKAFAALPDLDGRTDIDTIFSEEHLSRFPPAFQQEVASNSENAKSLFLKELNNSLIRFKSDRSHWQLIQFSKGNEKTLSFNGEATDTAIQLCAPLYLTDGDRRIKRASVYAVAELRRDPESGEHHCYIPSILDNRMAIGDMNNLARAVNCSL